MNGNGNEEKRYITQIEGNEYITAHGLRRLMEERYGIGKFSLQAHLPNFDELKIFKEMLGAEFESGYVIMRGEVWIEGNGKPFIEYGTAHRGNLTGIITFNNYPVEMAVRRALNRAMRLATGTDMCSVDELPGSNEIDRNGQNQNQNHGQNQAHRVHHSPQYKQYNEEVSDGFSEGLSDGVKQKFIESIDGLKNDGSWSSERHRVAMEWINEDDRTTEEVEDLLHRRLSETNGNE